MRPTFHPSRGSQWLGRYDRIPGDQSAFHLRYNSRMERFWPLALRTVDGHTLEYWFAEDPAIRKLADTVGALQRRYGGQEGGSFLINEWGQVLVPCGSGDGRRYFAGVLQGEWVLTDPDTSFQTHSLNDDDGLECGDPWDLPYVGVPYRLSKGDRIYFTHRGPAGDRILRPEAQDRDLIASLRSVRRWGPVRFIVNPFGVVLTKKPPDRRFIDEEAWQAVYVGRIDYDNWFSPELPTTTNLNLAAIREAVDLLELLAELDENDSPRTVRNDRTLTHGPTRKHSGVHLDRRRLLSLARQVYNLAKTLREDPRRGAGGSISSKHQTSRTQDVGLNELLAKIQNLLNR